MFQIGRESQNTACGWSCLLVAQKIYKTDRRKTEVRMKDKGKKEKKRKRTRISKGERLTTNKCIVLHSHPSLERDNDLFETKIKYGFGRTTY